MTYEPPFDPFHDTPAIKLPALTTSMDGFIAYPEHECLMEECQMCAAVCAFCGVTHMAMAHHVADAAARFRATYDNDDEYDANVDALNDVALLEWMLVPEGVDQRFELWCLKATGMEILEEELKRLAHMAGSLES